MGKKRRVQVLSEKAQALIARLRELEIAKTAPGLVAVADHGDPHPPFSLERTLELQLQPDKLSVWFLCACCVLCDGSCLRWTVHFCIIQSNLWDEDMSSSTTRKLQQPPVQMIVRR